MVSVLCEMQPLQSRIWTRVAVSISYDDNHYTTGTSYLQFELEFTLNFKNSYSDLWKGGKLYLTMRTNYIKMLIKH